jgi:acyl-CoA dehydrogenase
LIINGQKVWTSLAHESEWIFVLARCEAGSVGNRGLVFLLVPLDQPGIEIRPIRQLTGTAEFTKSFSMVPARRKHIIGQPGLAGASLWPGWVSNAAFPPLASKCTFIVN